MLHLHPVPLTFRFVTFGSFLLGTGLSHSLSRAKSSLFAFGSKNIQNFMIIFTLTTHAIKSYEGSRIPHSKIKISSFM